MSLAAKLLESARSITHVEKRGVNKEQKYEYVTDATVSHEVRRACHAAGLFVSMRSVALVSSVEITNKHGTKGERVTVSAIVAFIDPDDGACHEVQALGSGFDYGDKAIAKATTGAVKIALLKGLCLPTGDDPEGDEDTDRQPSQATPQRAKPQAKAAPAASPGAMAIVAFAKEQGMNFATLKAWIADSLGDQNLRNLSALDDLLPDQVAAIVAAIKAASEAEGGHDDDDE